MRIDYTEWWNDMVAIARGNASILVAIAAAFVFLPTLVGGFFMTPMLPAPEDPTLTQVLEGFSEYLRANWPVQIVLLLISTLGQLLVLAVLVDPRRPSVGSAFRLAAPLYLPLLIANVLARLAIGAGSLFIIPGLYLLGRLLLTAPALVGERLGPFAALRRSWTLTRGQGWRILFFAILIFLVALVVQVAVNGTLGTAFGLLPGADDPISVRNLLLQALTAVFASLFFVLATAMWVALYRRLAAGSASSAT